jgi:hypothetical protein
VVRGGVDGVVELDVVADHRVFVRRARHVVGGAFDGREVLVRRMGDHPFDRQALQRATQAVQLRHVLG